MPVTVAGDILERSSTLFESHLWESQIGGRICSRLAEAGIDAETLRRFRVGYAPGDSRELVRHLAENGHSPDELITAGLATRSDRSRVHVLLHARIVFPFTDAQGGVIGFAGLATHLGPSWPLWLTSTSQGPFDAGTAMFGFAQASATMARRRRALVVRDCVQVLALHQAGRREVVAVIHSPLTRAHMDQLAAAIGTRTSDLHFARRDDRLGVLAVPSDADVHPEGFAPRTTPAGFTLVESRRPRGASEATGSSAQDVDERPEPARPFVYVAGAILGVGVPVGLLLIAAPHNQAAAGDTPTLNFMIGGVVAAYFVLALVVARISAQVRARSRSRRMREPWARGSGEWQPRGWTYHRLEEILVGAALVSAVTCLVLWMTVGGFFG